MSNTWKHNIIVSSIHIIAWSMLFIVPIFDLYNNGRPVGSGFPPILLHPISLMTAFYLNYFILIDKLLFRYKHFTFILLNLLLITILCIGLQYFHEIPPHVKINHPPLETDRHIPLPHIDRFIRDSISILSFIGLSIALKTIIQWRKIETRNHQLEQERIETELKNLKNQLNPHFLFNTLNNIYSLIAVNSERAQQAVLELSRMMRYILYENKERYVPIEQELNFLNDYIELMRLRLNKQTSINVDISVGLCNGYNIAPLMFIPLIENAFKHGIDPLHHSFINISIISIQPGILICTIKNSYFPKDKADNSGSGIGLDNLRRQLQLLYPNKHNITIDKENEIYQTILTINLNPTT